MLSETISLIIFVFSTQKQVFICCCSFVFKLLCFLFSLHCFSFFHFLEWPNDKKAGNLLTLTLLSRYNLERTGKAPTIPPPASGNTHTSYCTVTWILKCHHTAFLVLGEELHVLKYKHTGKLLHPMVYYSITFNGKLSYFFQLAVRKMGVLMEV